MFHFRSLLPLLVPLVLALGPELGFAQSKGGGGGGSAGDVVKRAERRESQRWTLKEWLEQKDRNRMMDIWLSMNSPSPYELMLGISYNSFNTETLGAGTPEKHTSYQGSFAAYAQFVGFGVEYENNTQENFNDLSGLFNLRLIGSSIQGSYLALHYGLRTRTAGGTAPYRLAQQFGQASLQMYVIKHFGFDGHYRYYLPTTDDNLGDVKTQDTEAGAFIDFKNFRVFGSWYKEVQNAQTPSAETETTRSGIRTGLKFFF